MKRLKLFPKIFLYTLGIMLFIVLTAHALLFILSPRIVLNFSIKQDTAAGITMADAVLKPTEFVVLAIQRALPLSLLCCLIISVLCSLIFSRAIAKPIERISKAAGQMTLLDKSASCPVYTRDEIGLLAENVNRLYHSLLSTIENLEREKELVCESERSKAEFLRAASHELKTPVTALSATLENMILGVGKYRDHDACLPECRKMVSQLSDMIRDILDASGAGSAADSEPAVETDLSDLVTDACEPYRLIAGLHGIRFSLETDPGASAALPPRLFGKALSNILANAAAYTKSGGVIRVAVHDRCVIIENECDPLPGRELNRIFEPFYRPDFSRSRDSGGNGLGLYLVDRLLTAMGFTYSFTPMDDPEGMRFTVNL